MASTHSVASDLSYRVFQLRQSRGELTTPKPHVGHETAYIRRDLSVYDRLRADADRRFREQKRLLSKG